MLSSCVCTQPKHPPSVDTQSERPPSVLYVVNIADECYHPSYYQGNVFQARDQYLALMRGNVCVLGNGREGTHTSSQGGLLVLV